MSLKEISGSPEMQKCKHERSLQRRLPVREAIRYKKMLGFEICVPCVWTRHTLQIKIREGRPSELQTVYSGSSCFSDG